MPIVIIIYLVVLLAGLIAIFWRRQVLLLRGKTFLGFNLLFTAIAILVSATRGRSTQDFTNLWFWGIVLAISILLREKWFLFKHNPSKVSTIIEESLSRVLMSYRKSEWGYTLDGNGNSESRLRVVAFPLRCAIISFEGEVRGKKVEVLRNLVKKNFDGIFPRLVIKL